MRLSNRAVMRYCLDYLQNVFIVTPFMVAAFAIGGLDWLWARLRRRRIGFVRLR